MVMVALISKPKSKPVNASSLQNKKLKATSHKDSTRY